MDARKADALTVEDLLGDEFETIAIQPRRSSDRPSQRNEAVASRVASGAQPAAAAGRRPAGLELEHAAGSHSSTLRGMVAKIRGGFASTAVTSIPSPNSKSQKRTARPADGAGAAALSAPVHLPLTQRKEMGLRALEGAREAMVGSRGGKHWRQTSAGRFGKREQPTFGRAAERPPADAAQPGFSWSAELDFVYDLLR